ncbi:MAG TPA: glycosyltransferase family 4 protein [Deltaproteobacteria bacterium]|nr:glycosyltransferase family 4 protein [Deltaproteobacteria bacterium]
MVPAKPPALGMILKGFPRISETFISNEILLLEKAGFQIHIFSMRRPRESFSHSSVKNIRASVDYLPETLLVPLPRFLYHNLLLAGQIPTIYRHVLKSAFLRFRQTRKLATIKHFLQAGYLVHKFLPEQNVVHLHAHFAHSPASVASFTSQLSGLPFSFTAHAKDIYTSDPKHLGDKIDRSEFVVTCTEHNKEYLAGIANSKKTPIYRIYHGIDTKLFNNRKEITPPETPYRLLTVARITRKKGIPTVLKAIRLLCDEGFPIEHILIGDGDERKSVLALMKDLKLDNISQWLGTLPHVKVLAHYRQSDLFVIGCEIAPNGDRDGIPNVILESMAMGVPVVSTHVSAIPEVIADKASGLLVPPHAPEEMAEAIKRLLTDFELRKRVIESARTRVMEKFDNRLLIRNLASVFAKKIPAFSHLSSS